MELALLKNASHANAARLLVKSLPRAGFAVALRQRLDAAGRQGVAEKANDDAKRLPTQN